ncbi:MAG: hypothetical protein ACLFVJ_06205 [Persicimonas sp.]
MNTSISELCRRLEPRDIFIALLAVTSLAFAASCVEDQTRGDHSGGDRSRTDELQLRAQATGAQSEGTPAATRSRSARIASQSARIDWIRQFGTASTDSAEAVAASGEAVYVVGATGGSLESQRTAEEADAYVQKYDTSGRLQWTRQFGTDAADHARAVAEADGSVYVVGSTGGALSEEGKSGTVDGFVRRYDDQGNALWTRQLNLESDGASLDDTVHAVTVYDSMVYVVGESTASTSRSGHSRSLAFIQSYGADGELAWSDQFFVDDRSSRAWDVAANGDGVYVSGDTPSTTSAALTTWDAFVRRYDSGGSWKFTRLFDMNEEVGPDTAVSVVVDDRAAYIIGESFQTAGESRRTHFVRKLDANGNFEWTRFLKKTPRAIAVDAGMLYVASGTPPNLFAGQTPAENGVEVKKFDTTGQIQWTRRLDASGPVQANSLAVSATTVYVAGSTDGTFPGKTNAGGADAFVARLIEPVDRKRQQR